MKEKIKSLLPGILAYGAPTSINFISIIVFTRILSLEDYGKISLVWISIEFGASIFFLWSKMSMMRLYDKDKKSIIIGTQINILISFVLVTLIVIIIIFKIKINYLENDYLFIIIIGIILRGASAYIQDIKRITNNNINKYTVLVVILNVSYYIPSMIILLIKHDINLIKILYVQILGLGVAITVLSLKPILKNKELLINIAKHTEYKAFYSYGLPIILTSIALGAFVRIDRYIIENILGYEKLGIYSAAFTLSNLVVSSAFSIISITTYPRIINNLNDNNKVKAIKMFEENGNFLLRFVTIGIILSYLLNEIICTLIFGKKGLTISTYFPLIALSSYIFNLKTQFFDQIYQFIKKTKTMMILSVILGIGHVLVSYNCSKRYGLNGIVLSNILISVLGIIFIIFNTKTKFNFEIKRNTIILNILAMGALIIYYL